MTREHCKGSRDEIDPRYKEYSNLTQRGYARCPKCGKIVEVGNNNLLHSHFLPKRLNALVQLADNLVEER